MKTTYPAAEDFARKMRLPIMVDQTVKELYGYTTPALNTSFAADTIAAAGFRKGSPAHDAAMAFLQARFESYLYNRVG